jgi:kexin
MVNEFNGTFIDWHLKLWGECIDPSKATLLPMPNDSDDDNHDQIISTTTIAGATTTLAPISTPTSVMTNPTDHPDRPVNAKPSGTTEDENTTPTSSGSPAATTSPSSWLPSFFPTFGVSPKTQIWIYGSAALIVAFCSAIGIYLFMARRKRLRNNPRDEWEFDLLEEDEAEGLNGGGKVGGKKGGKRRAGELYDAFAAGSEDESEDEYVDGVEGGDEEEKRLYEDSDDEGRHVIGDDEDEEEAINEKTPHAEQ